jgi:putative acetyltransferase
MSNRAYSITSHDAPPAGRNGDGDANCDERKDVLAAGDFPRRKEMKIRAATRDDADAVRRVHLSVFPKGEGDIVSQLAVDLLFEETAPPVISLVSEADDIVVGHVALSPVRVRDTRELLGYILAPLAVSPDYQKRGIGSQLIKSSIGRLSETGPDVLLVYGDPGFYGRFGFSTDIAECYTPPYHLQYPFGWQGLALRDFEARRPAVSISCVSSLSIPALW